MASSLRETRIDHNGHQLPPGIYALIDHEGNLTSYKTRWREEGPDGVARNAAKSFSIRKLGSAEQALQAAVEHRGHALQIVKASGSVPKPHPAKAMTIGELFEEWCVKRGPMLSQRYAVDTVKRWDREIETRSISRVKLERLSQDPSILTRFQDELLESGLTASNRAQVLKTLRAVLRWGRRRYPNALAVELSGLFELPTHRTQRLAYAADAYALERIIEAVLSRTARDPLLPLRDAALVAAMGFTIAARPSEWLYSATWGDLHHSSIELQRPNTEKTPITHNIGLKTGARAALLLPNARERIEHYRNALQTRFGPQPINALIFQTIGPNGPTWTAQHKKKSAPVPWTYNDYKRWTARIWRPARQAAALAPDTPPGLTTMRFYDCRHTAISMALHSTLVTGPHGMNLHNLAGWAGHDVQTLQRYYAHIIARYQGTAPIDLTTECETAKQRVEAEPNRNLQT